MSTNVVITGLGAVTAFGAGVDALAAGLASGAPRPTEIELLEKFHRRDSSRTGMLIRDIPFHEWIPPMVSRRMSSPSRFAVVAAKLALEDSGLGIPEERDPTLAVNVATTFGPSSFTQKMLDQILDEGPEAVSPFYFTECVANAPAAQVSIHTKACGPNLTVAAHEAGPSIVIGRAAADIRNGRARRCLAGAVEEMTPLLHALLDRFRSLARSSGGGPELARPFEKRRNGFVGAEGACLLVLEREEDAVAREARIRARVRGWGSAFDPSASRIGWGSGVEVLARGLRRCLDRAEVTVDEIDLIVSGASGSLAGDRLEALTLNSVWNGRDLPPLVAPKAITGEYGGGFLGAALLATEGAPLGSGTWFEQVDPQLGIRPWAGAPIRDVRHVLVTCLASGGCGAWLVLERP